MNKEEVLKMAQRENSDEREVQIKDKSLKWTYITMVIVAAVFAFIREQNGQPMMDLCATVSASVCVGQIYRFIRTRKKENLLIGIITLAIVIFSVIRFCMGH